jgi:hypothetical protein
MTRDYKYPLYLDMKSITAVSYKGGFKESVIVSLMAETKKYRVSADVLLEILSQNMQVVPVVFKYNHFHLDTKPKIKKPKKNEFLCTECNGFGSLESDQSIGDIRYCQVCRGTGIITWAQEIFLPSKEKK